MASPYEVEHNIKDKPQTRSRRPDMSSFFNQISQIATDSADQVHNNPNATPTPVETAAAYRLLQEQYTTLLESASDEANIALLDQLISDSIQHMEDPPEKVKGVPQSYLDTLERVPKKQLKKTDSCPICGECFLDDPYPLVVELSCHKTHRFDLDCVGPWLRLNGTCPLDRKDLMKKEVLKPQTTPDDEEEEDYDRMYG